MEFIRNFPLFTIILSLFSGALCMILRAKAARNYTIAYEALLIAAVSCVLVFTWKSGESFSYTMGEFPAPWGNEIRAGVLEAFIALIFLVVMLCSVLAGYRFIVQDIDETKHNLYFSLLNLLTSALMAIIWTNDIFTGYVFLEILTLTSCGILIVREIGRTTLAAVRYMVLNLVGSGLFLLGVTLLYDLTGQLLMEPMRETVGQIVTDPSSASALVLSVGILTIGLAIKSGLFPFYFWMPDTYGWATPSSGSILSCLVSKAYIFLLFKIYFRSIGIDIISDTGLFKILFVLGICSMVFGSIQALYANNINRMIAFSSASQIGYIYMGIGLGTSAGYEAAIFSLIAHTITKGMLFLTSPYLAEVSGNSLKFHMLQGSAHRDRLAGAFFTIGSLSMMGIPIFAGFSSKLMLAQAAVMDVNSHKIMYALVALALSSLLTTMYFIRTLIRIYSDTPARMQDSSGKSIDCELNGRGRSRTLFIVSLIILSALNLFLGLFSWIISDLIYKGLGMFL